MSDGEPPRGRGGFSRAWRLLGRRSASSALVAWIYAPFGLLIALTLDRELFGGSVPQWLGIAGLGQLMVVGLLPLLGWVVHRFLSVGLRPAGTLVVMLLVAAARGTVMDVAARQLDLLPPESLTHWLVGDLITQAGFLILIGVRVSSRRAHEAAMVDLDIERRRLVSMDAELAQRITDLDQRLSIQMGLTVVPRLHEMDRMLDSLLEGADPQPVVTSLTSLIDNELRPLSHRLSDPVHLPIPDDRTLPTNDVTAIAISSRVGLGALVRPVPVAVIVGLFSFGQIDAISSLGRAMVFSPLIVALIWVILTAAVRALRRIEVPLWWGIALAALITSGAVTLSALIAMAMGSAVPDQPLMRSALGGALLGVLSAAAALVDAHQMRVESFLREQITLLTDSISVARQRIWVTRRRLGYTLHGMVQSALHVAAMRLSGSEGVTPAVVASIRADIGAALTRLGDPSPEHLDFEQACRDLAHTWEGTCAVTWQVDPAAAGALAGSPVLCECSIEVVLEAAQNAIRHGHASTVRIEARGGEGRIELTVSDNGQWVEGVLGQGTRMMDELCAAWGRERLGSGTQVRAELMVS